MLDFLVQERYYFIETIKRIGIFVLETQEVVKYLLQNTLP